MEFDFKVATFFAVTNVIIILVDCVIHNNNLEHNPEDWEFFVFDSRIWLKSFEKRICKIKKLNGQVRNCNIRDKLFRYMRPLLDIRISSKQAYVRVLAYLKLLKLVYASVLEFDVLFKFMIKFWNRDVRMNTNFDSQMNICFKLQTIQSMQNCNNWYQDLYKSFNKMSVHLGFALHTHAILIYCVWHTCYSDI